jgi:hypothetical protein
LAFSIFRITAVIRTRISIITVNYGSEANPVLTGILCCTQSFVIAISGIVGVFTITIGETFIVRADIVIVASSGRVARHANVIFCF